MEQGLSAPSLPFPAQLGGSIVLLIILIFGVRLVGSRSGRFVVLACWFRLMLSAFPKLTFPPLAMGLSINAVGSIAIFVLGLALLDRRLLLSKGIMPVYLLILVILLSTVINALPLEGFETLVKFGYFTVLALHTFQALRDGDHRRFTLALILSFSPLVLFQLLSIILGVHKAGEVDGSASYIGGYNHEGHFAMGLMGLFVVACLAVRPPRFLRLAAILAALLGIYLANYRTAVLGALPLLALLLATYVAAFFAARLRPAVIAVAGAVMVFATAAPVLSLERFADLRMVLSGQATLIKPPETFGLADRRLLTGRPYVWSQYYYGWAENPPVQKLVGRGPNSWQDRFKLYAHNSFVDFLYEYGIFGVIALCLLLGSGLLMAARAASNQRAVLLAAHVSFLLLNMATMPMWQIEGLILYALLWGFTLYGVRLKRAASKRPAVVSPNIRAAAVRSSRPRANPA
jgi:O-antigen ligase